MTTRRDGALARARCERPHGRAADYALSAKWYGEAASATKRLAKTKLDPVSLAAPEEAVKSWHAKSANPDANEDAAKAEWGEDAATSSGAQKENVALVSRAQALLTSSVTMRAPPTG